MTPALMEAYELFSQSRWEDTLSKVLAIDYSDEDALDCAYLAGLCYTRLAEWLKAMEFLERVAFGSVNLARIQQCTLILAWINIKMGNIPIARQQLLMAIDGGYFNAVGASLMAYISWSQGRKNEAIRWYGKSLKANPDCLTALNGFAYGLISLGLDLSKAIELCTHALEIAPQNPACLDSAGWGYFKAGDIAKAQKLISEAISLAPNEPEISMHYSEIRRFKPGEKNTQQHKRIP